MQITTAGAPLVLKFVAPSAEGEFVGIAATLKTDRQGDRFAPGAFADTLASWAARDALPPLLWGHDPRDPIGALLDARETERGLEIVGRLALGTANGARAYELLKTGSGALALSVGVYAIEAEPQEDARLIRRADWVELSLVAVPAQPGAVVTEAKGVFPDRKTFEHAARNGLGLSASQAKRLAAEGWSGLSRNEPVTEPDANHAALEAALHRILLTR